LKRILPNLINWTKTPNEGYGDTEMMYRTLYDQFRLYNAQVMKNIGGQHRTLKSVEQPGPIFEPVAYEKQKAAMRFLDEQLFQTPEWLVNDTAQTIMSTNPYTYIGSTQYTVLFRLLGTNMILTMIDNSNKMQNDSKLKLYGIDEYMNDLRQSVWTELYNGKDISAARRGLQKTYINQAFRNFLQTNEIVGRNDGNGTILYINPDPTGSDAMSYMRTHLIALNKDIKKAAGRKKGLAKAHLEDLSLRIEEQLRKQINQVGK